LTKSIQWDDDFTDLSLNDISKFLYDVLYEKEIKEFNNWNVSKNNTGEKILYTSRYDGKRNPDDDFISLDALLHNVCVEIRNERREFDAFNKKFEEEQKQWQKDCPS
jgi:hypothetical protein